MLYLISSKIKGLLSKAYLEKVKQAHKLFEFPNIFGFANLSFKCNLTDLSILNFFPWLFNLSGNISLKNLEL